MKTDKVSPARIDWKRSFYAECEKVSLKQAEIDKLRAELKSEQEVYTITSRALRRVTEELSEYQNMKPVTYRWTIDDA